MSEWLYAHQYVKVRGKRTDEFTGLQERGSQGWELVSAVSLGKRARREAKADVLLLFKRPQNGNDSAETLEQPHASENGKTREDAKASRTKDGATAAS